MWYKPKCGIHKLNLCVCDEHPDTVVYCKSCGCKLCVCVVCVCGCHGEGSICYIQECAVADEHPDIILYSQVVCVVRVCDTNHGAGSICSIHGCAVADEHLDTIVYG